MASRTIIDALARGSIIELTPTQAFILFKKVADNVTWASSGRLLSVQPTRNFKGVFFLAKDCGGDPHSKKSFYIKREK
jgi:hypothetical protein